MVENSSVSKQGWTSSPASSFILALGPIELLALTLVVVIIYQPTEKKKAWRTVSLCLPIGLLCAQRHLSMLANDVTTGTHHYTKWTCIFRLRSIHVWQINSGYSNQLGNIYHQHLPLFFPCTKLPWFLVDEDKKMCWSVIEEKQKKRFLLLLQVNRNSSFDGSTTSTSKWNKRREERTIFFVSYLGMSGKFLFSSSFSFPFSFSPFIFSFLAGMASTTMVPIVDSRVHHSTFARRER